MAMYEVFELDNGCWRIEENGVRCFLLTGDKRAVLIDTGFGTGDLKAEVAKLTGLPVMLINTHADGDHIGCNHQFEACHMHPAEFDRYQQKKGDDVTPPLPLWEGETVDLGGRVLEVILLAGHTPGSIALLDRQSRTLYSGDSVQNGSIFMFGPGRNLAAYIASMEKLLQMVDLFDVVHPSHSGVGLDGGIVAQLLEGARQIQRGAVAGEPAEVHGMPIMRYDVGAARFLCGVPSRG